MTLTEFRKANNMKQEDMVEMLKPAVPWLTRPIFSLYERGLVRSDELSSCIQNVFGLESDENPSADKSVKEAPRPLTDEIWGLQTYILLRRAEEPLTRSQLVSMTGMSDREVRREIAELRKAGVRVASSSKTAGYWLCQTEEDYRHLRAEMYSRIRDIAKTIRAMDDNLPGQMRM